MKALIVLSLCLFCLNTFALEFKGAFWAKKNCRSLSNECIPQRTAPTELYQIEVPAVDSAKRLKIQGEEYDAWIYFSQKSQPEPFFMFQIELVAKDRKTLGLCSRYESVDTFETVPVGACAGTLGDRVIGFSVMLPEFP